MILAFYIESAFWLEIIPLCCVVYLACFVNKTLLEMICSTVPICCTTLRIRDTIAFLKS